MSTNEHLTPHDAEYGPTPPGAQYEHTDIDTSVGYQFALWLFVAMLISVAIVYGTFWFFENRSQAADAAAQKYPLAVGQERTPPAPNLQRQPFKDIYVLREGEAQKLGSYGWVDQDGGVVRVPIDRAMELLAQRGLPVRAEAGDGRSLVTQDSSSGRTTAPR
ncbi:MAG: hypothetical protein RJA55_242 [Acidobacteriota bacterium]|jgi:hypothetical protein